MTPVDLEAFAGLAPCARRRVGLGLRAHLVQVLAQNGETTGEAERAESLLDHRGTGVRILFQQFGDGGLEGIQFAGARPGSGGLRRR